jgi:hypothetical protein
MCETRRLGGGCPVEHRHSTRAAESRVHFTTVKKKSWHRTFRRAVLFIVSGSGPSLTASGGGAWELELPTNARSFHSTIPNFSHSLRQELRLRGNPSSSLPSLFLPTGATVYNKVINSNLRHHGSSNTSRCHGQWHGLFKAG